MSIGLPTCDEETFAMISKFNTVYAGHVDIPDRGQNAHASQRTTLPE